MISKPFRVHRMVFLYDLLCKRLQIYMKAKNLLQKAMLSKLFLPPFWKRSALRGNNLLRFYSRPLFKSGLQCRKANIKIQIYWLPCTYVNMAENLPSVSSPLKRKKWQTMKYSLPSTDSRSAVAIFCQKNVHKYWSATRRLSLPSKSVDR